MAAKSALCTLTLRDPLTLLWLVDGRLRTNLWFDNPAVSIHIHVRPTSPSSSSRFVHHRSYPTIRTCSQSYDHVIEIGSTYLHLRTSRLVSCMWYFSDCSILIPCRTWNDTRMCYVSSEECRLAHTASMYHLSQRHRRSVHEHPTSITHPRWSKEQENVQFIVRPQDLSIADMHA